ELPAGLPGLDDFQASVAAAQDVAKAQVRLAQAPGADVLAEGAWLLQQRQLAQLLAPARVVLVGVVVHGLVHAAMHFRVTLFVALQPFDVDLDGARDRLLGDGAEAAWPGVGHGLARQHLLDSCQFHPTLPCHAACDYAPSSRADSCRIRSGAYMVPAG